MRITLRPKPRQTLKFLARRAGGRYQTYLLMVYAQVQNDTRFWLKPLLQRYNQEYHLQNVAAMFQWWNQTAQVSTYEPYQEQILTFNASVYKQRDIFFEKNINFQHKLLKVAIFSDEVRAVANANGKIESGADLEIAKLIAAKLNATLSLRKPPDGIEYGNPINAFDGTGTLGQVMREEVDIAVNSRFLRLDLFKIVNLTESSESTVSIGRDDMCVMVPSSRYRSIFQNFIYTIDVWSWILMLTVVIFVTAFIRYTAQVNSTHFNQIEQRFVQFSYDDAIRSYFNQRSRRIPQALNLRLTILSWLIYAFIITNILRCCLFSAFAVKSFQHEIRTIDDLSKSNFKILVPDDYNNLIRRYFKANTNEESNNKLLLNKLKAVKWSVYYEHLQNNNVKFAYANKRHLIDYYVNTKRKNGIPLYQPIEESLVPFLTCYIVPYGSNLLGRINVIISRLYQAGIFQYWEHEISHQTKGETHLAHLTNLRNVYMVLELRHLCFAFYFLIAGHSIAFIWLLIEIYVSRSP